MTDLNYAAILVAAIGAFVASAAWYAAFGSLLVGLNDAYADTGRPPAWTILAEFARSLVVAAVLAGLTVQIGIDGWADAVVLGLVLWVAFPVVLLSGSVLHENVPWKLATIHAGDWLLKLVLIAVVVGVWR